MLRKFVHKTLYFANQNNYEIIRLKCTKVKSYQMVQMYNIIILLNLEDLINKYKICNYHVSKQTKTKTLQPPAFSHSPFSSPSTPHFPSSECLSTAMGSSPSRDAASNPASVDPPPASASAEPPHHVGLAVALPPPVDEKKDGVVDVNKRVDYLNLPCPVPFEEIQREALSMFFLVPDFIPHFFNVISVNADYPWVRFVFAFNL